ncbi:MAG: type II toxin-antitoxin system VapC family toxin [Acidimicrobiaceae bacterium]|nr:type II toxin-antitoxin system VapC family toxin [Acidimicrobiaceae bacterium]MYK73489.1 type II toxin-antitoxin system VapC family toxin [Acidimicrobiaceae bacterium]
MTTFVLDTGALIALERGDRHLWTRLYTADHPSDVQVPTGALAQAWRGSPRQASLARALKLSEEVPLDGQIAREAGALCGQTGTVDVIDASVAVTAAEAARRGDVGVVTSDRSDIGPLLAELGASARIVDV